jgi:hypothetical protein
MPMTAGDLFDDLRRCVERHGVLVLITEMDVEKPGEFDGLTIAINPKHDRTAASYYLAHSFGSIVQWSTAHDASQRVYDDLRNAKRRRTQEPGRFEKALDAYRAFEQRSSEHAVWMMARTGHDESIADYTVFFRADIEAMTIFHRTGKAPRWPDFYAEWKEKVAVGEIRIEPFVPNAIPSFQPVHIKPQEVLQERD